MYRVEYGRMLKTNKDTNKIFNLTKEDGDEAFEADLFDTANTFYVIALKK